MIHPSYVELMKVVNDGVEFGEEPVVNSRYSIVLATAKRARQIIAGAEGDGGQTCGNDSGRCEKRCFPVYRGRVKHLPF